MSETLIPIRFSLVFAQTIGFYTTCSLSTASIDSLFCPVKVKVGKSSKSLSHRTAEQGHPFKNSKDPKFKEKSLLEGNRKQLFN